MISIQHGDCIQLLKSVTAQSIDAIITDPPYAEVDRDYGRLSESDWHQLMDGVVEHAKRILKPSGSALFILQPNSLHVGQMRLWLWEFLLRTAKGWNLIQDLYWWNITTPPNVHCQRKRGLMRPSVKYLLWFGSPDCYRCQEEILWTAADEKNARRLEDRAKRYSPSGYSIRDSRMLDASIERGGSTPFNLFPISASGKHEAGDLGHGAGTPFNLCQKLVKYLCPVGGTVLDPFAGTSTVGLACEGRDFIGMEKEEKYYRISLERFYHSP